MNRILIYCEGPSEETFINQILVPYFLPYDILLTAIPFRGVSKYSILRKNLISLARHDSTAVITTMIDYYGLPSETPGYSIADTNDVFKQAENVESNIKADLGVGNLYPNLLMHEFEALLFSKPECFSFCNIKAADVQKLRLIRSKYITPEHINNSKNTAPSKRILEVFPQYNKILDGYNVAKHIGLDNIRSECKHFNQWIENMLRMFA